MLEIARAARSKVPQSQEKLKKVYGKLLEASSRVMGQAKRFSQEIAQGINRSADILQQAALEGLREEIDAMLPGVRQVVQQPKPGSSAAILAPKAKSSASSNRPRN
jgi:transposase, IS5 family